MSKLFIIFIFLLKAQSFANESIHPYEKPTDEQIVDQKENISSIFSKADVLIKDKEFNQQLEMERQQFSQIKVKGGIGYSFNGPQPISTGTDPYSPKNLSNDLTHDKRKIDSPIVFVTLSMPTKELKMLIDECNKIRASIVIRGFYRDLKTTILKIREISGDNGIAIDPTLFKKYKIEQVPAFILPLSNNKNAQEEYIKATGSVTLSYFLDLIIRTGKSEEILIAKSWRSKL